MDKQFSDLHAIQALAALNWWTCYANTTGKKIAWIPTIQALFYPHYKNIAGGAAVKDRMIPPQYYNKLMKIIPYGLADGTLSSSFPDPYELLVFLMRSVGIEETIIQNQLLSEGVTDPAKYMLNSVVKQQGKAFADQVIEVAKAQGVEAAQSMIDQYKSTGTFIDPVKTQAVPTKTMTPVKTPIPRMTLRGINNVNQTQGISKGTVILTSLVILTAIKAINS